MIGREAVQERMQQKLWTLSGEGCIFHQYVNARGGSYRSYQQHPQFCYISFRKASLILILENCCQLFVCLFFV